jgi:hypothetical protein
MASWRSAVVHPLGLAGYALACVFALLARLGPTGRYPWLAPIAVAMACVALVAALVITLRRKSNSGAPEGEAASPLQRTRGDQSPAIANVEGSVSIDYSRRTRR